ncbi:cytochrome P450 [Mollisia scopiformis]|uniref:Cytochrome P450 n=1 Tax=Mollisia scopiformis TaxID=149040 RepID=A0A132B6L0_MOLSC|nr:cytochrome P450 [Mollisia scopiformis]KUJ07971.1 cytochrome P450 [Mollisia scopiformis]
MAIFTIAGLDDYGWVVNVGLGLIAYLAWLIASRTYFNPLSKYPGPFFWSFSRIPHAFYLVTGRLPFKIAEFHERYGPIVRIAPDELVFIQEEAWLDIYGKPQPRNTQLRKDPSVFVTAPDGPKGILVEPNDEIHARLRRNLAPGFSDKALRDQEPLLNKHFDLLMSRFREKSGKPFDISQWYEFMTFDIIGDLTFGESFGCLESSKANIWLDTLRVAAPAATILGMLSKYPPTLSVLTSLIPMMRREEQKFRSLTEGKMRHRLTLGQRPDFIGNVQEVIDQPDGISFREMQETAGVLLVAGSDTTASTLAGVTYYLSTYPKVLTKLTKEIRSAFKDESEITAVSVNSLEYMLAVLNETLRIYPPVSGNTTRITPPEGGMIAGKWVPGETSVAINHWAAFHNSSNFIRPYEFIPERWLGAPEFNDDKKKVLQPFNVGPRNCLGRNLAYLEMRVVLARLVWGFDMEISEESIGWEKGQTGYMLWSGRKPLMVKLTPVARD